MVSLTAHHSFIGRCTTRPLVFGSVVVSALALVFFLTSFVGIEIGFSSSPPPHSPLHVPQSSSSSVAAAQKIDDDQVRSETAVVHASPFLLEQPRQQEISQYNASPGIGTEPAVIKPGFSTAFVVDSTVPPVTSPPINAGQSTQSSNPPISISPATFPSSDSSKSRTLPPSESSPFSPTSLPVAVSVSRSTSLRPSESTAFSVQSLAESPKPFADSAPTSKSGSRAGEEIEPSSVRATVSENMPPEISQHSSIGLFVYAGEQKPKSTEGAAETTLSESDAERIVNDLENNACIFVDVVSDMNTFFSRIVHYAWSPLQLASADDALSAGESIVAGAVTQITNALRSGSVFMSSRTPISRRSEPSIECGGLHLPALTEFTVLRTHEMTSPIDSFLWPVRWLDFAAPSQLKQMQRPSFREKLTQKTTFLTSADREKERSAFLDLAADIGMGSKGNRFWRPSVLVPNDPSDFDHIAWDAIVQGTLVCTEENLEFILFSKSDMGLCPRFGSLLIHATRLMGLFTSRNALEEVPPLRVAPSRVLPFGFVVSCSSLSNLVHQKPSTEDIATFFSARLSHRNSMFFTHNRRTQPDQTSGPDAVLTDPLANSYSCFDSVERNPAYWDPDCTSWDVSPCDRLPAWFAKTLSAGEAITMSQVDGHRLSVSPPTTRDESCTEYCTRSGMVCLDHVLHLINDCDVVCETNRSLCDGSTASCFLGSATSFQTKDPSELRDGSVLERVTTEDYENFLRNAPLVRHDDASAAGTDRSVVFISPRRTVSSCGNSSPPLGFARLCPCVRAHFRGPSTS